jgi:1-acyl-sn-glycerol-3-phosphate acyltransferase
MLKTVLFFIFMWVTIVLVLPLGIIAVALRLIGLRKAADRLMQRVGLVWARLVMAATGSTLEAHGLENIPLTGSVCFVGNHPGDFDILITLALIDRPFGFTAKKEALFFPFIGLYVWLLGGVFIDRKSAHKALKSIETGAERIRKGGAMIIFPEGTRNRGKGFLPFRPGAFKLATMADSPIVPVSITGSHKVWEEHMRIRGAAVRVVFGEPIPTAGLKGDERRALVDRTRAAIEAGLKS